MLKKLLKPQSKPMTLDTVKESKQTESKRLESDLKKTSAEVVECIRQNSSIFIDMIKGDQRKHKEA